MTTGNREDYLINILRLTEGEGVAKTTELATYMNVSPASVSEMIKVLAKEGLVNYEKYKGVSLTEEGLTYARQLRKKHHVLERFLTDYLNIDHKTAHEEACRMEHAISDESAIKMCHMMGTPVDSDCQSCKKPCKAVSEGITKITPLNKLAQSESGRISHITSDDTEVVSSPWASSPDARSPSRPSSPTADPASSGWATPRWLWTTIWPPTYSWTPPPSPNNSDE